MVYGQGQRTVGGIKKRRPRKSGFNRSGLLPRDFGGSPRGGYKRPTPVSETVSTTDSKDEMQQGYDSSFIDLASAYERGEKARKGFDKVWDYDYGKKYDDITSSMGDGVDKVRNLWGDVTMPTQTPHPSTYGISGGPHGGLGNTPVRGPEQQAFLRQRNLGIGGDIANASNVNMPQQTARAVTPLRYGVGSGLQGPSPIDKVNVMRDIGSGSGAAGGGLGGPANSGGGLLDSLSSGVSNLGSDIGSFFGGADDAGAAMGDMANMPTEGGEALSGLQGTEAVDAGGGMSGLGTALTGAGGAFGLYQGIEEGSALKMGGNAASLAMLRFPATAPFAWIPQIVNFF